MTLTRKGEREKSNLNFCVCYDIGSVINTLSLCTTVPDNIWADQNDWDFLWFPAKRIRDWRKKRCGETPAISMSLPLFQNRRKNDPGYLKHWKKLYIIRIDFSPLVIRSNINGSIDNSYFQFFYKNKLRWYFCISWILLTWFFTK